MYRRNRRSARSIGSVFSVASPHAYGKPFDNSMTLLRDPTVERCNDVYGVDRPGNGQTLERFRKNCARFRGACLSNVKLFKFSAANFLRFGYANERNGAHCRIFVPFMPNPGRLSTIRSTVRDGVHRRHAITKKQTRRLSKARCHCGCLRSQSFGCVPS